MRDPGGRRQERGEGKEGEVGLLWIRWPSQKVPLKMVVQAREGFGLASMGTLVSPAFTVVFEIYISPLHPLTQPPNASLEENSSGKVDLFHLCN